MSATDLTEKWAAKELTEEDILTYLAQNIATKTPTTELSHVAQLCLHLYLWSTGQLPYLGDFLTAVVNNDLTEAVHRADGINRGLLWVYTAFLYNVAQRGWREVKRS